MEIATHPDTHYAEKWENFLLQFMDGNQPCGRGVLKLNNSILTWHIELPEVPFLDFYGPIPECACTPAGFRVDGLRTKGLIIGSRKMSPRQVQHLYQRRWSIRTKIGNKPIIARLA